MRLSGIFLAQQLGSEPALTSGWLDPLFMGFLIAAGGQLALVVWALRRNRRPKRRPEG